MAAWRTAVSGISALASFPSLGGCSSITWDKLSIALVVLIIEDNFYDPLQWHQTMSFVFIIWIERPLVTEVTYCVMKWWIFVNHHWFSLTILAPPVFLPAVGKLFNVEELWTPDSWVTAERMLIIPELKFLIEPWRVQFRKSQQIDRWIPPASWAELHFNERYFGVLIASLRHLWWGTGALVVGRVSQKDSRVPEWQKLVQQSFWFKGTLQGDYIMRIIIKNPSYFSCLLNSQVYFVLIFFYRSLSHSYPTYYSLKVP